MNRRQEMLRELVHDLDLDRSEFAKQIGIDNTIEDIISEISNEEKK